MSDSDIQPAGILGFCAATCGVCGIFTTVGILSLFLFSWGIAGCVWIFGVYNQVQSKQKQKATYCDETLYRAAFWLVIIAMAYYVYGCCCSGFRGRQQLNVAKKKGTGSGPLQP